jgi:hypothetical protein
MSEQRTETGHAIFELLLPDRHIKIYANGVVEGAGSEGRIVNCIGSVIKPEWFGYFSKSPFTPEKDCTEIE